VSLDKSGRSFSTAAILVAAGSGSRFSSGQSNHRPKQFLELKGQPIYSWALTTLLEHPQIDRVVVATLPEMVAEIKSAFQSEKLHVTTGGAHRQESVWRGLSYLDEGEKPAYVLVHDAARPFLDRDLIDATIETVQKYGACTVATPASDTIKRVDGDLISETLDRDQLVLVQTPQAARFDWLIEGHRRAIENGFVTTDDASILEAAGRAVAVVQGSRWNIKITRPEDLIVAEALADRILPPKAR
jgi:2-C-methyl-D-erythritol 4-phosphate cytidylyltransferase